MVKPEMNKYFDSGDGVRVWTGTPEEEAAYLEAQPSPTQKTINNLTLLLDNLIMAKGQEKRYSGPDSYTKYIISNPDPESPTYEIEMRYKAESLAMVDWIRRVFATSEAVMGQVLAGKRGVPTEAELIAELPKAPW